MITHAIFALNPRLWDWKRQIQVAQSRKTGGVTRGPKLFRIEGITPWLWSSRGSKSKIPNRSLRKRNSQEFADIYIPFSASCRCHLSVKKKIKLKQKNRLVDLWVYFDGRNLLPPTVWPITVPEGVSIVKPSPEVFLPSFPLPPGIGVAVTAIAERIIRMGR